MLAEGSAKDGAVGYRIAGIAKLPGAAVDRIHVACLAGHDADRQTAGNDLAIGGDVGADAEQCLRPPRMHAKTRDHLVENQRCTAGLGDLTQSFKKSNGLQVGAAALHRFDHHRR